MPKLLISKKIDIRKQILIIISSAFTFIFLNLLLIDKNVLISSLYEELMVYNLGFSSLGNLVDADGVGSEKISKYKKLTRLTTHLIKYPFLSLYKPINNEKIPIIEISIPYENLEIIYKDRINAIKKGYLKDPTWTEGIVKYGDKDIAAKIRLKGILSSHWEGDKRFSLRIKLRKNLQNNKKDYLLGMSSFSIHKLRARQYPYENIFQEILPEIGLKATTHKIVRIKVNGIDWGLMDMQEHISDIMLEKNNLKNSLVVSFNDEVYWTKYSREEKLPLEKSQYWLSNPRLFVEASGKSIKKFTNQEYLYYSYILNTLQNEKYQNILFNKSYLNNAITISSIWGNYHALADGNTKYYFNPFTLKLEPLMSDQGPFKIIDNDYKIDDYYSGFLNAEKSLYKNNQKLSSEIITLINSKSPYEKSEKIFPYDLKLNTNIPNKNYLFLKKEINKNKLDILESQSFSNKKDFYTNQIVCGNNRYLLQTDYGAIKSTFDGENINIHNLLCGEVQIKKIKLCGLIFESDIIIDKDVLKINEPYTINKNELLSNKIKYRKDPLANFEKCIENDIEYIYNQKYFSSKIQKLYNIGINDNPLLKENTSDFFKKTSLNNFILEKNIYKIKKPLFIDGNLIIEAGSKLKFSENAFLIIKGNINIKGTENNPVKMTSINKGQTWKGIYVFNENINKYGSSFINNLNIENISELDEGILNLTGGINFYNLNLKIKNLKISNSQAEDALNIIKSNIEIDNLDIKDTKSDAFDCDFCKGEIANMQLHEIGGDGLDLSGSDIKANIIKASNIKDKVVSVGEKTNIKLDLRNVSNSFVGVAVKDSSNAYLKLSNLVTIGAKVMAYDKKPFYEGNTLVKVDYVQTKNEKEVLKNEFLANIGTKIILNNQPIKNVLIDVDNLYKVGPMRKK